jgi:DNA-directed RNA polymerase II subunit RPB2
MISHGAARFFKERTMDVSDRYRVFICDICGLICEANLTQNSYYCRGCDNKSKKSAIHIPYESKLLF